MTLKLICDIAGKLNIVRTFQTMLRGKDAALKEPARKRYLEGLRLRTFGRILGVHHKTVSLWLVQAAWQLPTNQRHRLAPLLRSINSAALSKKNPNAGSG